MAHRLTWLVAAATLVLGFVVAQATGVRPLGGVVLLVGATWCAREWHARRGTGTTVALLGVFVGVFVLSHVAGLLVGTWPAVLGAAATMGGAAWRLSDRDAGARQPLPATMSA